ncbi:MAG: site-2 protease family protein [Candidatus Parvarchaeota archaeon]|nr:site-2 protease family protein [Candidatus Jingweiarchaeum tengchongense]MCW1298119.1 site-2 protease family protein [Candidatus Jingweiarchaeum tengchongense]MCW1299918.1 site-2 protease family protein [Candidatus Jingweiarchaeum tengchongense]MCW1305129.1 site-2 protease family protein [Candidatus Jingweiarchaeum tengchongense]MCW1305540.1 site-2 protease family protein [Candidatus Jingweiarchaeum tengchongense]
MQFGLSKQELRDIIISVLVLGFVFSYNRWETISIGIRNFFIAVFVIGIAFLAHELAHRYVARKYECKAEYVIWPAGLLLAVVLTILSGGNFIFAAPGFVMISTAYATRLGFRYVNLSREEVGKIALSGPITGIFLAMLFKLLQPLSKEIFTYAISINLWLAIFNLLPIPPLDGSKVFAWSISIWGFAIVTASVLFILYTMLEINFIISLIILIAVGLISFLLMETRVPTIF